MSAPLLCVKGVSVDLPTHRGMLRAVDGIDLTLRAGRTLGIAGESGSDKTMLSRAILGLLPARARLAGRVRFEGEDLTRLDPRLLRKLRGRSLGVVFQDPMTSLNPVLTIGAQIVETLREHLGLSGAAARSRAAELLAAVGIAAPEQRLRQYPHQLSGGMRQRAVIAIALSCEPRLLIADEPTTALDVTIQAQILDLLAREQRRRKMAMISHHPRSRRAGRTHRRDRRDVCGPRGRTRTDRSAVHEHAHALYAGAARGDSEARSGAAHAACDGCGPAAGSDPENSRMRLCSALPLRGGTLPL
jgi:peptide/nickel transport system ATP-binding protein